MGHTTGFKAAAYGTYRTVGASFDSFDALDES
jgi:hypothetical protein